jgi:hypothetical protein
MLVQSIRWSIESHLYTEYMYVLKLLCHRLAHINYSIRPSIRPYMRLYPALININKKRGARRWTSTAPG